MPIKTSIAFGSNTSPISHLVIQTNEGDVYFYQPFKQGHLKVEVLGQIVHISTGAQLGRETSLRFSGGNTLTAQQHMSQAPVWRQVLA